MAEVLSPAARTQLLLSGPARLPHAGVAFDLMTQAVAAPSAPGTASATCKPPSGPSAKAPALPRLSNSTTGGPAAPPSSTSTALHALVPAHSPKPPSSASSSSSNSPKARVAAAAAAASGAAVAPSAGSATMPATPVLYSGGAAPPTPLVPAAGPRNAPPSPARQSQAGSLPRPSSEPTSLAGPSPSSSSPCLLPNLVMTRRAITASSCEGSGSAAASAPANLLPETIDEYMQSMKTSDSAMNNASLRMHVRARRATHSGGALPHTPGTPEASGRAASYSGSASLAGTPPSHRASAPSLFMPLVGSADGASGSSSLAAPRAYPSPARRPASPKHTLFVDQEEFGPPPGPDSYMRKALDVVGGTVLRSGRSFNSDAAAAAAVAPGANTGTAFAQLAAPPFGERMTTTPPLHEDILNRSLRRFQHDMPSRASFSRPAPPRAVPPPAPPSAAACLRRAASEASISDLVAGERGSPRSGTTTTTTTTITPGGISVTTVTVQSASVPQTVAASAPMPIPSGALSSAPVPVLQWQLPSGVARMAAVKAKAAGAAAPAAPSGGRFSYPGESSARAGSLLSTLPEVVEVLSDDDDDDRDLSGVPRRSGSRMRRPPTPAPLSMSFKGASKLEGVAMSPAPSPPVQDGRTYLPKMAKSSPSLLKANA